MGLLANRRALLTRPRLSAVLGSLHPANGGLVSSGLIFDSNVDFGTSTTTNGANAASITEQAGGIVLAQATGANQPQYTANKINGHPALHFIAANTTALIAQAIIAAIAAADDVTAFIVLQSNSTGAGVNRRIFDVKSTPGNYGFSLTQTPADAIQINYGTGSGAQNQVPTGFTFTNATPRAIAFTLSHTTGFVSWWDSVKQTGSASGFIYSKPDNDPTPANRSLFTIGMDHAGTNPWDGWIPRLMIYNRILSNTEMGTNFSAATAAYGTA